MKKHSDVYSCIKNNGGVPALFVNGKPFTSVAYMTYLEKFNEYDAFAEAGYRLFSVPVLFSGRWISASEGFTPFKKGIFDEKGSSDFSVYDETIKKILDACPDAYIIPRVNISMPEWWEKENPAEVNIMSDGSSKRESFYSEKWREDATQMLREFLRYSDSADFAPHIIGYHIAGGNTEEWFHFDNNAGCCENAEKGFKKFLSEYYPETDYNGLPDMSQLNSSGVYLNDPYLTHFLEYSDYIVADSICHFAAVAKEETENNVVIGVFYGYSMEVTDSVRGTHSLETVLKDKNVDFICSPNSYLGIRGYEYDWTEMYAADSVRLHGKMCFQECDIRTHLTEILRERDPATDPDGVLSDPIWHGLSNKEQARSNILKSFSRQLIKGNGMWWFDMWGGWYNDKDILNDMALYRKTYSESLQLESRKQLSEIAVFIDESSFRYLKNCDTRNVINDMRIQLGISGVPYDAYDVFDFEQVYKKYKAVIFASGVKTPKMVNALEICKNENIPYIMTTHLKKKFTARELRSFCETNGAHIYCESSDIVYINENYASITALSDGLKTISLKSEKNIEGLSTQYSEKSDKVTLEMKKGETVLFRLS